jgi:hypothetical protein
MITHYAAIYGTTVIGARSSASRSAEGSGKFGPYTNAVASRSAGGALTVVTWHGSAEAARQGLAPAARYARHWGNTSPDVFVVPVVITTRRGHL